MDIWKYTEFSIMEGNDEHAVAVVHKKCGKTATRVRLDELPVNFATVIGGCSEHRCPGKES